MCLLVCKPANVNPNIRELYDLYIKARRVNDDGFGFAYAKNGDVWSYRTIDKLTYLDFADLVKDMDGTPAILHWRWATGGYIDKDNCHPFLIYDAMGKPIAMAHNGIMDFPEIEGKSDTRQLAEALEGQESEVIRKILDEFSDKGNKLASLDGDGKLVIHDSAKVGYWDKDGLWYSNYSHEAWSTKSTTTCGIGFKPSDPQPVTTIDDDEKWLQSLCFDYGYDGVRKMIDDLEMKEAIRFANSETYDDDTIISD